ncbi:phosphatase PAP2 family protein [Riemerella columbipharyngis]|uniref:phosphatase PAP2 family protein n=1 Tax=Riemerella columbipharyngis TaxID=1071918 RepID=UPI000B848D4B|nr:phosphatase PAP2 family protein [Riemerella columbipharyngis]
MDRLINIDHSIFLYLNNLGAKAFDPFWVMVSSKLTWVPLYMIFLYLIFKNFSKKQSIYILIFITLGVICSDQLANIFKFSVERLRPCHDPLIMPHMRIVECGGAFGFYSSHASNSFFLANFLYIIFNGKIRGFWVLLFPWAVLVSYSRIYLGVHYPLDILFGAGIGGILGGLFANLSKWAARNK